MVITLRTLVLFCQLQVGGGSFATKIFRSFEGVRLTTICRHVARNLTIREMKGKCKGNARDRVGSSGLMLGCEAVSVRSVVLPRTTRQSRVSKEKSFSTLILGISVRADIVVFFSFFASSKLPSALQRFYQYRHYYTWQKIIERWLSISNATCEKVWKIRNEKNCEKKKKRFFPAVKLKLRWALDSSGIQRETIDIVEAQT